MTDTVSLSTLATNTVCVSVSTVRAEQGSEMDLADHLVVVLQGGYSGRSVGTRFGHAPARQIARASAPGG
jgi:hypothetical protein